MADTLRIKRRAAGGAAGPPSALAAAEIAFNEQDRTLYYGSGNSAGLATSIIPIGGSGAPVVITSDTAPASPSVGQLWFDTVSAQLYVYSYDGTSYQWLISTSPAIPQAGTISPFMDGTAAAGTTAAFSRSDHVHPTDTSRASVASVPVASSSAPAMNSVANAGTLTTYSRGDHIHPTDTTRFATSGGALSGGISFGSTIVLGTDLSRHIAFYGTTWGMNIISGTIQLVANNNVVLQAIGGGVGLLGVPTAPTAAPGTNTTQIATTAFAAAAAAAAAGVTSFNTRTGPVVLTSGDVLAVQPASTITPIMDGTAAVGTNATSWARADHVHPTSTLLVAASGGTLTGGTLAGTIVNSGTISGGEITGSLGLDFGSVLASSSIDLSKHIALFGTTYGLNVTSARLNIVTPSGGTATFWNAGTNVLSVGATINVGSVLSIAGNPIYLSGAAYALQATPANDGSSLPTCNIQLTSYNGTGLTPWSAGQTIPAGLNGIRFDVREGYVTANGLVRGLGSALASQLGCVRFIRSGTDQQIDIPTTMNYMSTAVTVAAGGTGWAVNDRAYDANNCTYTVSAVSAGAVTAIAADTSLARIGAVPTNPVALTAAPGFTGTGLTVNQTWLPPARLVLQHAAGGLLLSSTTGAQVTGGMNFGSQIGTSSTDLSKHIALFGTTNGIGVSSLRQNYVAASNNNHVMVCGTTDVLSAGTAGIAASVAMTAPTPALGNSSTNVATTAFVQANMAATLGRNMFHNPMFTVQQRGLGPWTVTQSYTADRWALVTVTPDTDNVTITSLVDADRAAIGDEAATFALTDVFVGSATAGAVSYITQRVEGVRRLAGKSVTISCWAVAASGAPKLGFGYLQVFGTGGGQSANNAAANGQSVTLSTTWTRYSVTLAIPSAATKTFGATPNTDYTAFEFWFSGAAAFNTRNGTVGVQSNTISLWGLQLEMAPLTPLEKPDPRYDLSNCQRFYTTFAVFVPAVAAPDTIVLPTTMRVIPTVAGGGAGFVTTGAAASAAAITVGQTTGAAQTLTFTADL